MPETLHTQINDKLIPASNRPALVSLAEGLMAEIPTECVNCPAAFLCVIAMSEDNGYGFPRTPTDVRAMNIKHGEGSYSMLSGQAQFGLKGIVSEANRRKPEELGPKGEGDKCCLDPGKTIDINNNDPYGW